MVLCYKSTFLGTLLHLRISDGLIEVKTDNLSVLAIIKDSVSASAGQRKLKLNIEMTQVEMESVNIIIDSIYPKVQNQYTIAQRF